MALTPSNMLPLGTKAPSFVLPDAVSGKQVKLEDFASPIATVIMFICNHCPYVKHLHGELPLLAQDYQLKSIAFIAISANDATSYPEDGPEKMQTEAKRLGYTFPYLYDATQVVARAYQAACTPDFFVFDKDLRLAYRGQFDDSRPGNGVPVSGHDIRTALDAILAGRPVSAEQKPSIGCNIKWKD